MVEFLKRFLFTEVEEDDKEEKGLEKSKRKVPIKVDRKMDTMEGTQVFQKISFGKTSSKEGSCLGAQLKVIKGPEPGMIFRLGQKESRIGRRSASEVSLRDPGVSRDHALISFENFSYYLEDMASLNGTFLNGRRIMKQKLSSGDKITIGTTELEFRLL